MGKKLVIATDAQGVASISSQSDATVADVFTTMGSQDTVLTGAHGLAQRVAAFEAGAIVGGMRAGKSFVQAATLGFAGNDAE